MSFPFIFFDVSYLLSIYKRFKWVIVVLLRGIAIITWTMIRILRLQLKKLRYFLSIFFIFSQFLFLFSLLLSQSWSFLFAFLLIFLLFFILLLLLLLRFALFLFHLYVSFRLLVICFRYLFLFIVDFILLLRLLWNIICRLSRWKTISSGLLIRYIFLNNSYRLRYLTGFHSQIRNTTFLFSISFSLSVPVLRTFCWYFPPLGRFSYFRIIMLTTISTFIR